MEHSFFSDCGEIQREREAFQIVVHMGDSGFLEDGWTYHPGPGMPCIYSTKSKAAVRKSVARGCRISAEAFAALNDESIASDEQWHLEREQERAFAIIEEEKAEGAFWDRVKRVEQKLTAEEIEMLQAAYRD